MLTFRQNEWTNGWTNDRTNERMNEFRGGATNQRTNTTHPVHTATTKSGKRNKRHTSRNCVGGKKWKASERDWPKSMIGRKNDASRHISCGRLMYSCCEIRYHAPAAILATSYVYLKVVVIQRAGRFCWFVLLLVILFCCCFDSFDSSFLFFFHPAIVTNRWILWIHITSRSPPGPALGRGDLLTTMLKTG